MATKAEELVSDIRRAIIMIDAANDKAKAEAREREGSLFAARLQAADMLCAALKAGEKIAAINALRCIFPVIGLKEAKDAVEGERIDSGSRQVFSLNEGKWIEGSSS